MNSSEDRSNGVTGEQAREQLEQIQLAVRRAKQRIAAGSTAPLLILWGGIWFIVYVGTYLTCWFEFESWRLQLSEHVSVEIHIGGLCSIILVAVGMVVSWLVVVGRSPTRSVQDRRWWRCWLVLFVFAPVWLALLWPWNEYQMSAFIASLAMFLYVIMGLWGDRVLLWLGVAVTLILLCGFFVFHFHPLFWLWMAVVGGGALAGTGAYIQHCWR